MDRDFKFFNVIWVLFFVVFIGTIIFRIALVTNAINSDTPMYEISVNSFNRVETYITTEYERDQGSGCIRFKDEFGIKHIVCNNYTITEYGK